MFDIGMTEMLVVGILALVVVGPKELPKLLRTMGGFYRKIREMTADFREGVQTLAAEAERELDPFEDLRKSEGLRPGMNAEEITDHILANREHEAQLGDAAVATGEGTLGPQQKSEKKPAATKQTKKKPTPKKSAPKKSALKKTALKKSPSKAGVSDKPKGAKSTTARSKGPAS
jgi:sec-independent protein translocase protein TatB